MNIKIIKCLVTGHQPEGESVIRFISAGNWLKKCSCCGRYIGRSERFTATFSEKEAMQLKEEFERIFGGRDE